MTELKPDPWKDGKPVKGTYHVQKVTEIQQRILVSCPKCGKISSLGDHMVDDDGFVRPSVQCDVGDCDWHETPVRLLDWTPVRGATIGYRPTWSSGGAING